MSPGGGVGEGLNVLNVLYCEVLCYVVMRHMCCIVKCCVML